MKSIKMLSILDTFNMIPSDELKLSNQAVKTHDDLNLHAAIPHY